MLQAPIASTANKGVTNGWMPPTDDVISTGRALSSGRA
jgi:hypothetical protein